MVGIVVVVVEGSAAAVAVAAAVAGLFALVEADTTGDLDRARKAFKSLLPGILYLDGCTGAYERIFYRSLCTETVYLLEN